MEPGLSSRAGELLDRVMREERHRQEFDIISGRAGAIATLIVLSQNLANPTLLEFAALLGDELLESAIKSNHGCSWESRDLRNRTT